MIDRFLEKTLPSVTSLNILQTLTLIEINSNLPSLYWYEWNTKRDSWNNQKYSSLQYCNQIQMIPIHKIKQTNQFWQILPTSQMNNKKEENFLIYIYNSYYDNRFGRSEIKILTSCDQQELITKLSFKCLLWFDDQQAPILSNVTEVYSIWPKSWAFGINSGIYGPQIITCSIPELYGQVPRAVSLVNDELGCPSKVENIVRVIYNNDTSDLQVMKQNDTKIGICVHAFRYRNYEYSVRLVEWLEMVRLMGATKVYFYVFDATDSIYSVLRHYAKEGFIDWRFITLPGMQPNVNSMYQYYYEKLQAEFWPQELLEINDCLYRNIYRHEYIALFDIDEMLMPKKDLRNWHQVIQSIESKLTKEDFKMISYYAHKHAYVYEMYEETERNHRVIPTYLHMMRHNYRAEPYTDGTNVKCFHRTKLVNSLHNHFPMRCLNKPGHHNCFGIDINPFEQSILMHYRPQRKPNETCTKGKNFPEIRKLCTIHDRTSWKWYDELEPNVRKKLIQIFKSDL